MLLLQIVREAGSLYRGLREYDLVSFSDSIVASAPIHVKAQYARDCRVYISGIKFLPKYGLLGDARIGPPKPVSSMGSKKKKKTMPTIPLRAMMEERPSYVPWTHDRLHPSAIVREDQMIIPALHATNRQNRVVSALFRYLRHLYYTKKNWKRLLATARLAPAVQQQSTIILDSDYFDMETISPAIASSRSHSVHMVHLLGKGENGGPDHIPKIPVSKAPQVMLDFGDIDLSYLFVDGFGFEEEYFHRQKAIVFGPYPLSEEAHIQERVAKSAALRDRLGVGSARFEVVRLMLYRFPIPEESGGLRVGRTGVFVVQVPHQTLGVCMSVHELHTKMHKEFDGDMSYFYQICRYSPRGVPPLKPITRCTDDVSPDDLMYFGGGLQHREIHPHRGTPRV